MIRNCGTLLHLIDREVSEILGKQRGKDASGVGEGGADARKRQASTKREENRRAERKE